MNHLSMSRDSVKPPGALSCNFKLKVKRCKPLMACMSWQVQQLHHATPLTAWALAICPLS